MAHSTTEPASRFKSERFSKALENNICKSISNEALVPLANVPPEYNKLAVAFKECLDLYSSSVVPTSLLHEARKQFKVATCEFESKMKELQMDSKELRAIVDAYHKENLKLLEELADIQTNYQMDISRELQKNDICYKRTKTALTELDLISKETIEQSEFTIYGKSLVDLYFYVDTGATAVKSAVIRKLEDFDDDDVQGDDYGVICGVTEFKVQTGNLKAHCSQIFSDMIRVGSLLAVNALAGGKIIDKIVVYGLLLDYKRSLGLVTKYYVNFNTDESVFFAYCDQFVMLVSLYCIHV